LVCNWIYTEIISRIGIAIDLKRLVFQIYKERWAIKEQENVHTREEGGGSKVSDLKTRQLVEIIVVSSVVKFFDDFFTVFQVRLVTQFTSTFHMVPSKRFYHIYRAELSRTGGC
jgi:hypothetical protein